jgi:hypothetical protein
VTRAVNQGLESIDELERSDAQSVDLVPEWIREATYDADIKVWFKQRTQGFSALEQLAILLVSDDSYDYQGAIESDLGPSRDPDGIYRWPEKDPDTGRVFARAVNQDQVEN